MTKPIPRPAKNTTRYRIWHLSYTAFAEWTCGVDFPARWEPIRRDAILPPRAARLGSRAPARTGSPERYETAWMVPGHRNSLTSALGERLELSTLRLTAG